METEIEHADVEKVDQALEFLQNGNSQKAESILRDVCSRCPNDYVYEYTIGNDRYIKAWDDMEFLSCLSDHHHDIVSTTFWVSSAYPRACYHLAYILIEKRDFSEAITWLNKGMLMEPKNPKFLIELGIAYSQIGEYLKSLDYYRQTLTLSHISQHQRAVALRGAGVQFINLGRLEEAEIQLKESLELETDNAVAINEMNYISKIKSEQISRSSKIRENSQIKGITWDEFVSQIEQEFKEPLTDPAREAVADYWNHWTSFTDFNTKRLLSAHINVIFLKHNFPQYKRYDAWKGVGLIFILIGLVIALFSWIIGIILLLSGLGIRYYSNHSFYNDAKAYAEDIMKEATINPINNGYARLCANYIAGVVDLATQQLYSEWPQHPSNVLTGSRTFIETDYYKSNNNRPSTNHKISLFPVHQDCKFGYMNQEGRIVINPQFEEADDFVNGFAILKNNDKSAILDQTCKVFFHPDNFDILFFSEGLGQYQSDDKWGFINQYGAIIIEPLFDFTSEFSEGLAGVEINGKWGFIDKTGRIVIEPQFEFAGCFSEGLTTVKIGLKWGFIDRTGNIVIDAQFDEADDFYEDLAMIKLGLKYGFINRSGKIIIDPKFDQAGHFSEGLARIKTGFRWGFIDKMGKVVIETQFDNLKDFSNGLAVININYGQGLLDRKEKFGFIDHAGKIVIEPQFDSAYSFSNGLSRVKTGECICYIDSTGKYIWKPRT